MQWEECDKEICDLCGHRGKWGLKGGSEGLCCNPKEGGNGRKWGVRECSRQRNSLYKGLGVTESLAFPGTERRLAWLEQGTGCMGQKLMLEKLVGIWTSS